MTKIRYWIGGGALVLITGLLITKYITEATWAQIFQYVIGALLVGSQ